MLTPQEIRKLEQKFYKKLTDRLADARGRGDAKSVRKLAQAEATLKMKNKSFRCVSGGLPETSRRKH